MPQEPDADERTASRGPQRPAVRKKEFALGADIGNACQLMSSPLDGRFRGHCGVLQPAVERRAIAGVSK
ncbi:hypothetical protein NQZ68_008018 [Dissostichus eleginoides]|nr:hypothetical protein NQZ68_008018 [Dissostichus eleginoides]